VTRQFVGSLRRIRRRALTVVEEEATESTSVSPLGKEYNPGRVRDDGQSPDAAHPRLAEPAATGSGQVFQLRGQQRVNSRVPLPELLGL
jgi:hypothetical protein